MSDEVCGYPTSDNTPCQLPAGPDGTCHLPQHEDTHRLPDKYSPERANRMLEAAEQPRPKARIASIGGIHRHTLRNWQEIAQAHPDCDCPLCTFCTDLRQKRLDHETSLVEDVVEQDPKWLLGASYDYSTKQEIEHSGELKGSAGIVVQVHEDMRAPGDTPDEEGSDA